MDGSPRKSPFVLLVALVLGGMALGRSQDQSTPPPQAQPEVPAHLTLPPWVTPGLLIKKVKPKYPKKARKQKIEGVVVLSGKITKGGDVADLTLISGDPLFAEAAIDAVQKWKYHPYLLLGKPVEVRTQIQVNFELPKN
jgi:TonB family protein